MLSPVTKVPFKDLFLRVSMRGTNKMDFRIYDLFVTILPKPVKATLEIKTTARFSVAQDIPITNPYDVDCSIKPTLVPITNSHLFEINKDSFVAKKNSVTQFPIRFFSPWVDKAEARLELFNSHTNDKFEYHLVAAAEEPLSEDNIQILTKAKTSTEIRFRVRNPIKDATSFKVTCDIPGAEFPPTVNITDENFQFLLTFLPKLGGQFLNAITFTDDRGRYFWYLVTLKVDPPQAFKELSFQTEIRKPIVCKIDLENTSQREVTYQVVYQGEHLSGNPTVTVAAGSTETYNLIYYPSKIEEIQKKLGFLNAEEGEIWFDLVLSSQEAKPIKLPTFKTELGKTTVQKIPLKNFLRKKSARVEAHLGENSNFALSARSFEIGPNSSYELQISYTPKELNRNENEVLVLSSAQLGDWKYLLFGVGVQPTDFEEVSIVSYLGKNASKTVSFRNPFPYEITVQVFFEQP